MADLSRAQTHYQAKQYDDAIRDLKVLLIGEADSEAAWGVTCSTLHVMDWPSGPRAVPSWG